MICYSWRYMQQAQAKAPDGSFLIDAEDMSAVHTCLSLEQEQRDYVISCIYLTDIRPPIGSNKASPAEIYILKQVTRACTASTDPY